MGVVTVFAAPPHPVPSDVRAALHKQLDRMLDENSWVMGRNVIWHLDWFHPESQGHVSIEMNPPRYL